MLSSSAQASGEFQVRFYSFSAPQTLADALSVQLKFQSPPNGTTSYAADLLAELNQQNLTARYTTGRHSFQVQVRRQLIPGLGSAALSGTVSYSYAPSMPATGLAISSFSTYYSYSGSTSPTQSVHVNYGGVNVGVRLSDTLSSSVTGSASLTDIQAGTFSSVQRNASLAGGVYYRKDNTSASLNPSVTWTADAPSRWNLSANARTTIGDNLTLSANTYLASGATTTSSAEAQYDASALLGEGTPKGKLSVGAGITVTPPAFTVTGRVRSVLTPQLTVGASVGYTPSTSAVTYAADASGQLGALYLSANTSLSTQPDTEPAFSVGTSLSSQAAPLFGSLSLGYRKQGANQNAYSSGTFGYRSGKLDVSTTLALNATTQVASDGAANWVLYGSADLTATYAVQKNWDVSGSVRYEAASGTTPAHLRYGLGLRYRF